MNQPSSPRLPKWPFFCADAGLLLVALYLVVFEGGAGPLSPELLVSVVVLVGLAAILAVSPFWIDYTSAQRTHDAALRAKLEGESARLQHAAEVIGVAAANLKSAQESTARAMHAAEALPYRMQEKIGELTTQLQQMEDDDKTALEKEIELLREAEGEKLEAVAEKIRGVTKEFAAIEKEMRPALDAAVKQGRDLEETLRAATSSARATLLAAETKLKAAENHARAAFDSMEQNLQARLAELKQWETASAATLAATAAIAPNNPRRPRARAPVVAMETEAASATAVSPASAHPVPVEAEPLAAAPTVSVVTTESSDTHANGHREVAPEVVVVATNSIEATAPESIAISSALPVEVAVAVEVSASQISAAPDAEKLSASQPKVEVAPVAEISEPAVEAAVMAEVSTPRVPAPTSRRSERRAVGRLSAFPDTAVETSDADEELTPVEDVAPKREPRRRSVIRTVDDVALPGFADHEIVYDDALNAGAPTAAKTSDGTTRLLVTAYIGIGNKVFVRGEGPGLSWEKGVPLEFVSIGKWSWQAAESAGPIRAQLYKNDETKALGDELVLEPGHHVEVRPIFREPNPF